MKVFISWSGELSKQVAELLKEWIPNVLQNADPWVSTEGIQKGEIWFGTIMEKLAEIRVGITCLTKQNLNAPWILFETGAVCKGLPKSLVCTLLIDINDPNQLPQPLSQFNATKPDKVDMFKLIKTINSAVTEKPLPDARVQASFEQWWPLFEDRFKTIIGAAPDVQDEHKPDLETMTSEILGLARSINSIVQAEMLRNQMVMTPQNPWTPNSWGPGGPNDWHLPRALTLTELQEIVKNAVTGRIPTTTAPELEGT